jgi:hypothetical protein
MGALLLAGIAWYSSRPKPWTTDAIKASYADMKVTFQLDNLPVEFEYDLENKTRTNYSFRDGSGIEVLEKLKGNVLSKEFGRDSYPYLDSSVTVSGPSFIPPKACMVL